MQRITDPSAAPYQQFTDGDDLAGLAATIVRALWLNGVQEELINLLTKAGIVPNAADNTQIWQALQKLYIQNGQGARQLEYPISLGWTANSTLALAVADEDFGDVALKNDLSAYALGSALSGLSSYLTANYTPKGNVRSGATEQIIRPLPNGQWINTLTVNNAVPGVVHGIGGLNVGDTGIQPYPVVNILQLNGATQATDSALSPIVNSFASNVGVGPNTVTQIFAAGPGPGPYCTTGYWVDYLFVPA